MLQEIQKDAVLPTVEALLAFLERQDLMVPGDMLEKIVSGKSLLRALLQGQVVIATRPREKAEEVVASPEEEAA